MMKRAPDSIVTPRPHQILGAGKVPGRLLRLGHPALGKEAGLNRPGMPMRQGGPGARGKAAGLKDAGTRGRLGLALVRRVAAKTTGLRSPGEGGANVLGLLNMRPGKGWGEGRIDCPDYIAWLRQLSRSCRFRSRCCRCG